LSRMKPWKCITCLFDLQMIQRILLKRSFYYLPPHLLQLHSTTKILLNGIAFYQIFKLYVTFLVRI